LFKSFSLLIVCTALVACASKQAAPEASAEQTTTVAPSEEPDVNPQAPPRTTEESARAADESLPKPRVSANLPEMSWKRRLILGNITISKWFDSVADGLDRYLVEKQRTARPNETSVNVENISSISTAENFANSTSLSVNLRLPNVEEYWHLKFTTYDDLEEKRSARRGILRNEPREKNYGATLGFFGRLGKVRTAFQPRLEFAGSLKIAHSLTFESVAETPTYQVNPRLEFYATPSKGAGSSQSFNVHFPFNKVYSLTLINQGDYQDRLHLYTTNNGLSLGQALTEKTGLGYGIIFDGSNQTNYHLTNYTVSVTYSELVFLKILDYQLSAYVGFPQPSFAAIPGLTFTTNIMF
jgi:hypothetical protein